MQIARRETVATPRFFVASAILETQYGASMTTQVKMVFGWQSASPTQHTRMAVAVLALSDTEASSASRWTKSAQTAGSSAKPATFAYTGPNAMRFQGNATKASESTPATIWCFLLSGNKAAMNATTPRGKARQGSTNIDALMAMVVDTPARDFTMAQSTCQAAG